MTLLSILAAAALSVQGADVAPMPIKWADLLPEGETLDPVPDPEHDQPGAQTGSVTVRPELDGQKVEIDGFLLPLDYTERGLVTAFLLVRYFGACIHVPPPPPNQIIYVETKDMPVKTQGLWDPVTITGTIRTRMKVSGLADAAYSFELDAVRPFED